MPPGNLGRLEGAANVRQFTEQPLPEEALDRILDASDVPRRRNKTFVLTLTCTQSEDCPRTASSHHLRRPEDS